MVEDSGWEGIVGSFGGGMLGWMGLFWLGCYFCVLCIFGSSVRLVELGGCGYLSWVKEVRLV